MPSENLNVLHIATNCDGGAGIALMRYHNALLRRGVCSRILIAYPSDNEPRGNIANSDKRIYPFYAGIQKRLWPDSISYERMMRKLRDKTAPDGQSMFEQFSLPFSNYVPEEHPWIGRGYLNCSLENVSLGPKYERTRRDERQEIYDRAKDTNAA